MTLRLTPYLVMAGTTQEAIHFYQKALGAELLFQQSFGEMPENPEFPMPAEAKDLVAHAMVKVGESELMFSDAWPGQPLQTGDQVTICITLHDAEKSKQIFAALEDGGQVIMPLTETHFSPAYGQVKDKFGITFQIFTQGEQA